MLPPWLSDLVTWIAFVAYLVAVVWWLGGIWPPPKRRDDRPPFD